MKAALAQTINIFLKLIKYALIILAAFFLLTIISLAAVFKDLKAAALSGLSGKNDLSSAVSAIKQQDWSLALIKSQSGQAKISSALESLSKAENNNLIKKINPINTQIADLKYLLKTADILSSSLVNVIPLAEELDKIRSGSKNGDFSTLAPEDKRRFLKLIYESEPELNGLKANLDLALLNLNKTHRLGVLWPVYKQISELKGEMETASLLMRQIIPLAKLLPALAGYPQESRFLLIMQNNDELRPSGGFIGVYGLLESKDGDLSSLKTEDSYHLDMPAVGKWKMTPPEPISKYLKVENWYLRDANWSPDWPTAAKKIEEIYAGENKAIGQDTEAFSGIIAINPDLVADLLSLVGPITVQGQTYTADNFQPLLQYNVEVAYKEQAISQWNRKDIVNDVMNELKTRMFTLNSSRWPELLKIIYTNIDSKNLQIYFNDQNAEKLIADLGAGGEIKKETGDYLMVVDANLAAFKSDAVMKKSLEYSINKSSNGLNSTLKLNYRHEGGFDWRTTRYRSYTRIYVPLGSRFISLEGLDEKTSDFSVTNDPILNKTIFGFFFSVEPGDAQQIIINYQLDAKTAYPNNQYSLLMQKQSGRRTDSLRINLNLEKKSSFYDDFKTDKVFTLP